MQFKLSAWLLYFMIKATSVQMTSGNEVAHRALIIIDVQNCFTQGGTLAVADGNEVIPLLNDIRKQYDDAFDLVVFSQDWHCDDHVSFFTQFPGYNAYDVVSLYYTNNGDLCQNENVSSSYAINCTGHQSTKLDQTLWPPHCVINTTDADLHPDLTYKMTDVTVRKGYHCQLDSYSVFYDNGDFGETEMNKVLRDAGIDTVFITGLARDYCVYWTAKDALRLGYKTYVIEDATRPVSEVTGAAAIIDMKAKGIHVIQSSELEDVLLISGTAKVSAQISFILTIVYSLFVFHL